MAVPTRPSVGDPIRASWASAVVDSLYGDGTGWTPITFATGYTTGFTNAQYQKIGFHVVFRGVVSPNSGNFAASSTVTVGAVGALPTGFRPVQRVNAQVADSGADSSARMYIEPNGSIVVVTGASGGAYYDMASLSGYLGEV